MNVKQVIVIRRDLHMRQGKAVAQGAHAAMMFLIDSGIRGVELEPQEHDWLEFGMAKVCVRVESLEELSAVMDRAKAVGLKVFPITDAGHTEFHGIPTLTCCAIGPDYADKVDLATANLKLL